MYHEGPSSISTDTFIRSGGDIPEIFLRGVGLPDTFIEYVHSLVNQPIKYYTCFISYSSKDEKFVRRIHADLQQQGVRCWFAPENLKVGEKFWNRINESIHMYDKLLLVLSRDSMESEWVEREVMAALEEESKRKVLILFPIKLDQAVKETKAPWASDLRRRRNIGDFTQWEENNAYQESFKKLLQHLQSGISPKPNS